MHFAHRLMCTFALNSNFAILKTLLFFSIRVKELCEPIVLRKKNMTGFCFFLKHFLEKLEMKENPL